MEADLSRRRTGEVNSLIFDCKWIFLEVADGPLGSDGDVRKRRNELIMRRCEAHFRLSARWPILSAASGARCAARPSPQAETAEGARVAVRDARLSEFSTRPPGFPQQT